NQNGTIEGKRGGILRVRETSRGWAGTVWGPRRDSSLIDPLTLRFRNAHLEEEYHKEMDRWLIPALAISIFFLVVYGLYHMLVMPRLITSLALIIVSLAMMFFILLMLYIDYFHSFSQFITRTSAGHSVTILLILAVVLLCGVVNTFSCPSSSSSSFSSLSLRDAQDVCRSPHFSAFSFALFYLTSTVFVRFSALLHFAVLLISLLIYTLQIFFAHPPIGSISFGTEFDLIAGLIQLGAVIFILAREYEQLMRLDFLSAVKCSQECTVAENVRALCGQIQLNIVPPHLAPWLASRQKEAAHGEVLQHVHHTLGIAYICLEGLPLHGEQGVNLLNYIFSYFDQILPEYKGIEKVKSWNRYYVLAAGLLPDSHNVEEAPRTIGDLLHTLALFVINATQYATQKQFEICVGMDCGSVLSVLCDAERPQFDLWGDTLERAKVLCDRSATHGRISVSEEIFLALRPRSFIFSTHPTKVLDGLSSYTLHCDEPASATEDEDSDGSGRASKLEEQSEAPSKYPDGMNLMEAIQHHHLDMTSSMASSYNSELRSLAGGGETDSEIEWISPETAHEGYRHAYSEYETDGSRAVSRASSRNDNNPRRKRLRGLKGSLPRLAGWLRRTTSGGEELGRREEEEMEERNDNMTASYASLEPTATERLDEAARRVDRMLRELQQFGETVLPSTPREEQPFPTTIGSTRSMLRPGSSACHTEYDNDSDAGGMYASTSRSSRPTKRQTRAALAARTRRLRDASVSSIELEPLHKHWRSGYSIGYEDEYERVTGSEMETDDEEGQQRQELAGPSRMDAVQVDNGNDDDVEDNRALDFANLLEAEQLRALSRDIRKNFGEFQLASFDDERHV
ncbi:hypothetical protein PFISCL1PPCAC_11360, partial [Pristionchus fissidentatus]